MFILICLCLLLQRTAALSCSNGCTPTQLENAGCYVLFYDFAEGRAAHKIRCDDDNYNPSLEGVLYITNTEHLVDLIIEGQEITSIDPRTYKLANTTLQRVNVRNNKLTDPTPLVGMGEWCSKVYSLIMDNNPFTTFPSRTALNLPLLPNATQERDPYNLIQTSSHLWPAFGFCFSDGCLWQEINLQAMDDNADNDKNPTKGMTFDYRTGFVGELNILNLPSTLTKMNIYDYTIDGNMNIYGALKITAIAPSTFGTTPTERSRWTDLIIQLGLKSIAVNLFTGLINLKTLSIYRTELTALPASLFDTNTKLETLYLRNNAKLSTIDPLMFEKNVALVTLSMANNVLSSISAYQFEKNVLLECKLFLF
jgi:Leucine-rich repeat (LRR) protein